MAEHELACAKPEISRYPLRPVKPLQILRIDQTFPLPPANPTAYYPGMAVPCSIPTDIKPHDGRFVGGQHYFATRVYFEDTDFSGIVYHANYLRYMERARSDMLRQLDMDQNAAFESGEGVYAVVDLTMKYLLPAKLDDNLVVISTVKDLRAASVIIDQQIMRGSDQLTSASVHAAFLSPSGRPRRQPKSWTKAFASVMDQTNTK